MGSGAYLLVRVEAGEGVGEVHGGGQEVKADDAHAQNSGEEGQERPCGRDPPAFAARAHRVRGVFLEPGQRPSDGVGLFHLPLVSLILIQQLLGLRSKTHEATAVLLSASVG